MGGGMGGGESKSGGNGAGNGGKSGGGGGGGGGGAGGDSSLSLVIGLSRSEAKEILPKLPVYEDARALCNAYELRGWNEWTNSIYHQVIVLGNFDILADIRRHHAVRTGPIIVYNPFNTLYTPFIHSL